MNAEIRYYISVFFKRLPIFLLASLSISSAAVALAVILPTVFTAKGLLLVEAPKIPQDLAESTVQLDEIAQLEVVQRRLLTRANLLDIARSYDVYEDMGSMSPDGIVNRMRQDSRFNRSGRRNGATVLEVQFYARSPQIAAAVVNEYITRILADSATQRQTQAGDTLSFFDQEVERLDGELDLRSQEILRFQNENSDALPSTLDYRMNRQSLLQERLSIMARDRAQLEEQRARLIQMRESGLSADTSDQGNAPRSESERQLVSLQGDLSQALTVYSEDSPRVSILRSRIAALETQIAEQLSTQVSGDDPQQARIDEAATMIDLQIAEVDARLQFLEEDGQGIEEELSVLEDTIVRTPSNAIALDALEREYQNVQRLYDRAVDRLSQAVTGERIEVMSKGQRIDVIEQALPPSSPDSPNRPLIAMTGVVAGVGTGLGLIVLLEILNKAVRRPVDLTNGLGITPIATVPYIKTPGESFRRRLVAIVGILAIVAGIPALLYYAHYEVMPLDLLLDRIVTKLLP
ncbi:MAG: lipopolysaccharide biosynthesis [Pseudomonadota bacterium]